MKLMKRFIDDNDHLELLSYAVLGLSIIYECHLTWFNYQLLSNIIK